MRRYEFDGLDVLIEMRKLHQQHVNSKRSLTNEDVEQDTKYIRSFLDAAEDATVLESDLTIGESYFPMSVTVDLLKKAISPLLVTQEAEYIGLSGSRLEFRYKGVPRPIYFPQDEFLSEDEYRFVYLSKQELHNIVLLIKMKFSGYDDWTINAYGIASDGSAQQITNI